MSRGEIFPIGFERVAQNGYHYVKTPQGWRLKHHLVAEKKLGRPINCKLELVKFKDGNRTNFDPDNIDVIPKKLTKDERRMVLYSQLEQVTAQIAELEETAS